MVYEEVSSKRDIQPICEALGEIVIEDLDLSVRTYNCLKRSGIHTVSDLYEKLNEGIASCIRIRNLGKRCLAETVGAAKKVGYPLNSEVELLLRENTINGITEKENRVAQINLLDITMEKPDYSSYTDGTKGFTLFANIHNKSNQVMLVELKEFLLFCNGRQWVPSSNLTGYSFSAEHIMPMSSKTATKIWSGEPWVNTKLIDGDYVTIVIELNSVSHAFKFVLRDGLFIINDYCIF